MLLERPLGQANNSADSWLSEIEAADGAAIALKRKVSWPERLEADGLVQRLLDERHSAQGASQDAVDAGDRPLAERGVARDQAFDAADGWLPRIIGPPKQERIAERLSWPSWSGRALRKIGGYAGLDPRADGGKTCNS